jgi:hypothetical protein
MLELHVLSRDVFAVMAIVIFGIDIVDHHRFTGPGELKDKFAIFADVVIGRLLAAVRTNPRATADLAAYREGILGYSRHSG